ncbi:sulfatase-like hydrolase/transferase [Chromobacterium sp. IIBBL 290-4]|uniref:sulfatase-like hydrolase/transferase n=1 Tax=Chromobacterium sp. IIBBL 290-4 TaxID=2953890 RepID=UPI0020B87EB0|nr:sulfatase-like hydrolase/transferase [Chromobacterium sp. IIBBL 290-4]UTH76408.1 sulfatase-like hydrolase/transferase [Chromobacterium sp. IIBBL 290-4]
MSKMRWINNKKFLIKELFWLCGIALIYLGMDGFYAKERFLSIGNNTQGHYGFAEYVRCVVFIVEYILAISILYVMANLRKVVGLTLLSLLGMAILLDQALFEVYGGPVGISTIAILNAAVGNAFDAVEEYWRQIVTSVFWVGLLIVPLAYKACRSSLRLSTWVFSILFSLLTAIYLVILMVRGEPALIGFPKGYSYFFGSSSLAANDAYIKFNGDKPVQPRWTGRFSSQKVVLIIDESIHYDEFAAQGKLLDSKTVDYGRAHSGANCSAASNYILRRGTWHRDGRAEINLQAVPSVFELAKKAGYFTAYVDNQNVLHDPVVRNYIDSREVAAIDKVFEASGEAYRRDGDSLSTLQTLLRREGKVFIVVNKVGSHFPYENDIPPQMDSHDRLENYRRAVRHGSIDFLNGLSPLLSADTIVFYTSDHGQDLHGRVTHCNVGTQVGPDEYDVPMRVLSGSPELVAAQKARLGQLYNRLSHIELSESVRNSLGFEVAGVDSLFKPAKDMQKPFCGLYGPPKTFFGENPRCFMLGH